MQDQRRVNHASIPKPATPKDRISHGEILLILEAAHMMAHSHKEIHPKEESFLAQLAQAGKIQPAEFAEQFLGNQHYDWTVEEICHEIRSTTAKKILILALGAIAQVASPVDDNKVSLMEKFSYHLQVGSLNLSKFPPQELVTRVFRLTEQHR